MPQLHAMQKIADARLSLWDAPTLDMRPSTCDVRGTAFRRASVAMRGCCNVSPRRLTPLKRRLAANADACTSSKKFATHPMVSCQRVGSAPKTRVRYFPFASQRATTAPEGSRITLIEP